MYKPMIPIHISLIGEFKDKKEKKLKKKETKGKLEA